LAKATFQNQSRIMPLFVAIVLFVVAGLWLARWCFYRLAKACAEDFLRDPAGELGNRDQRGAP
jgi:DMSO reductase anchor subunit